MGNLIKPGSCATPSTTVNSDDGVILYYQDWGHGKSVVLVHGWPLNLDMWEYQARALAEQGFRVIAYDRRGFGRSTRAFYGHHYDQLASDLNDLMTQLDLNNVTLVGFSMGTGEVARYLTRYGSSRVEKVVLVSSILPYLPADESNPNGVADEVFANMLLGLNEDRPRFLRGFVKSLYGVGMLSSPVSDDILDWTFQMGLVGSPRATIECLRSFSTTDFRSDLKSFTMPTLIIHGSEDKIVPLETTSSVVAKSVCGAKLKIYDGAPHGLFFTHKEELLEDIILFVSSQKYAEPLSDFRQETGVLLKELTY